MDKIKLFQKRTLGETIGTSFDLLKINYRLISLSFLYLVMPIMTISMILVGTGFISLIRSSVALTSTHRSSPLSSIASSTFTLGIGYLIYFLTLFIEAVVIHEIIIAYEHSDDPKQITVANIWQLIKSDMAIILGSFFGLFPLWFGLGVVSAILYRVFASVSDSAAGLFILIIYIANVYLSVSLSNYLMLRLRSEYSVLQAFLKSISLTLGKWRWWKTLCIHMIMLMVIASIYTVSMYPVSIVIVLFRMHMIDTMPRMEYLNYIYIILTIALIYGAVVFAYAYNLVLIASSVNYYSLIEEKEHVGIRSDIANMGLENLSKSQEGDY